MSDRPRCWLDADGYHVWFGHACFGKTWKITMLPYPQWRSKKNVFPDNGAAMMVTPPIQCGNCGTEVVDHPITAEPPPRNVADLEAWLAS